MQYRLMQMTMSPAMLLNIIVGMAYLIINGLVGTFLLVRAKKAKLPNLIFLGLFFILITVSGMMQVSGNVFMMPMQAIGFVMLVPFTYHTFFKGQDGPYKHLALIAVVLAGATIVLRVVRLMTGLDVELYHVNVALMGMLVVVTLTWLARSALIAHRDVRGKAIEPWIKKRYLLVGWSTVILAWTGIAPLFMRSGAGFTGSQALMIISMVTVSLIHAILSYLCWVMPRGFKRMLNGTSVEADSTTTEMTEEEVLAMLEAAEADDSEAEQEVVVT